VLHLLVALVVLILSLSATAEAAPEHAEIAFVSGDRIWSSRADGNDRRLLVAPAGPRERLAQPAWSPDGSKLAYVSVTGDDRAQLILLDDAGARPLTPLRRGVSDDSPSWSPDGTALAFSRFTARGERYRTSILVRDLATGAERVLVTMRLRGWLNSVAEPSWSPDGATIAYTHSRLDRNVDFRHTIRTIPAAGGDSRELMRDARSAAWSPDGRRLAFASIRDRNGKRCNSHECWYAGELYTAAADGTGLVRLTRNEGDDRAPVWSPDGARILFASDRNLPENDSSEVYSVAADGTCLTWLTNGTPASSGPAWRPGSGTRYDPGSCDPGSRAPLVDPPAPPPLRGRLWLGTGYRGLLLSDVQGSLLAYDDCERFDVRDCPQTVQLITKPACRETEFRFVTRGYRLFRRRGALVAYYSPLAGVKVFSGHTVTTIWLGRANGLSAVNRVIDDLRPVGASRPPGRLPPPRIPRGLAKRLEEPALGRREARLRRALRAFGPYRVTSC
jgi:hypothetical protein